MWAFFIALAVLIAGFFVYSRVTEKVFGIDDRQTPAVRNPDGVDITPLPKWKSFLIELLNIAGSYIYGIIDRTIHHKSAESSQESK